MPLMSRTSPKNAHRTCEPHMPSKYIPHMRTAHATHPPPAHANRTCPPPGLRTCNPHTLVRGLSATGPRPAFHRYVLQPVRPTIGALPTGTPRRPPNWHTNRKAIENQSKTNLKAIENRSKTNRKAIENKLKTNRKATYKQSKSNLKAI